MANASLKTRRAIVLGIKSTVAAGLLVFITQACRTDSDPRTAVQEQPVVSQGNDAASRAAFLAAYPVFMHPRCLNCHPNGDAPLQGEDSHVHLQNVQRGPDGKGLFAMKCANCHQLKNLPGENMPPGHPEWHLPPANMRMVFEGKTPAQLARQLKDPKQNGGRTVEQIIHHVSKDSLVLESGWNPPEGRATPPLSHAEFARKMREWADTGAAIPE
jgi:mono/diheme cytochrome c family protein